MTRIGRETGPIYEYIEVVQLTLKFSNAGSLYSSSTRCEYSIMFYIELEISLVSLPGVVRHIHCVISILFEKSHLRRPLEVILEGNLIPSYLLVPFMGSKVFPP